MHFQKCTKMKNTKAKKDIRQARYYPRNKRS